jgi:hypothetical protein
MRPRCVGAGAMRGPNAPGASIALTSARPLRGTDDSMLSQREMRSYVTEETRPSDRSMLVLQYMTAVIAAIAAVVLAELR